MYFIRPIHWNIKSAPVSPGRSRVGPALYVFSLLASQSTYLNTVLKIRCFRSVPLQGTYFNYVLDHGLEFCISPSNLYVGRKESSIYLVVHSYIQYVHSYTTASDMTKAWNRNSFLFSIPFYNIQTVFSWVRFSSCWQAGLTQHLLNIRLLSSAGAGSWRRGTSCLHLCHANCVSASLRAGQAKMGS